MKESMKLEDHQKKDFHRARRMIMVLLLAAFCFLLAVIIYWMFIRHWIDKARVQELTAYIEDGYEGELDDPSIEIDDQEMSCIIGYEYPDNPKEYDQVRQRFNLFLQENANFFLNDGYEITVSFQRGELVVCQMTNRDELREDSEVKYHLLENVLIISMGEGHIKLSQMEGCFTDVRTIELSNIELDDLSVLQGMMNLERIRLGGPNEENDKRIIKEHLPQCIVETSTEYYMNSIEENE